MDCEGEECPKCGEPAHRAKSTMWASSYDRGDLVITIGKECECGKRYDHVMRKDGVDPPLITDL